MKSYLTIRSEHLYELEGFRNILGTKVTKLLKAGQQVNSKDLFVPECLSMRLRGHEQLQSFEDMRTQAISNEGGTVDLQLESKCGLLSAVVHLCFVQERLFFDATCLRLKDNGSVEALKCTRDMRKFIKYWIGNGIIEIWDKEQDTRLGQAEPVMLVNMMPNWDAMDAAIRDAEEQVQQRKKSK